MPWRRLFRLTKAGKYENDTYAIERTYLLPVFQHIVVEAGSPTDAMRLALENDVWDSGKMDHDGARPEFISGAWEGDQAYCGAALPIPDELAEKPCARLEASVMLPARQKNALKWVLLEALELHSERLGFPFSDIRAENDDLSCLIDLLEGSG